MKYTILFCILLFALPGFGQFPFGGAVSTQSAQDSVVYEKRVNTSETYNGDSIFYKVTYQRQGEIFVTITEPFTDVDSLMGLVLYNAFTDASRQYKAAILAWEAAEKGYQLRLRQAERQYLAFTGEKIKDKIESEFDFTELLGDWLLNGKTVKIDAKLEIDKKPIKILSDVQFTVEIDKDQQVFNRVKAGRWESKGGKYRLERAKEKRK